MGIFSSLSSKILEPINSTVASIPSSLVSAVVPMILTGLTIKIMWEGYNVLRGAGGQNALLDTFFSSLRTFFIFALCLGGGAYSSNIAGMLTEFRTGLVNLASGASGNIYQTLDTNWELVFDAANKMCAAGVESLMATMDGNGYILPFIYVMAGVAIMIVSALYFMVVCFEFLVMDMSFSVGIAFGPLFIACLAFKSTESYFTGWFNGMMSFIFTAAVLSILMACSLSVVEGFKNGLDQFKSIDGTIEAYSNLFEVVLTGFISYIVLMVFARKAPDLAGKLCNSSGFSSGAIKLGEKMLGGAGGVSAGAAAGLGVRGGVAVTNAANKAMGRGSIASSPKMNNMRGTQSNNQSLATRGFIAAFNKTSG